MDYLRHSNLDPSFSDGYRTLFRGWLEICNSKFVSIDIATEKIGEYEPGYLPNNMQNALRKNDKVNVCRLMDFLLVPDSQITPPSMFATVVGFYHAMNELISIAILLTYTPSIMPCISMQCWSTWIEQNCLLASALKKFGATFIQEIGTLREMSQNRILYRHFEIRPPGNSILLYIHTCELVQRIPL